MAVDGVTFRLVPPDVSVELRLIVSLGQKDNFQAGLQLVLWIISYKGKGESCLWGVCQEETKQIRKKNSEVGHHSMPVELKDELKWLEDMLAQNGSVPM